MYLSKLELFGFKSFAQRVQVKFDSGLTAIVGPNGCGKTNIVDAIRWVLGEQKTSVLRSDKMENVIFNGTKTRKPLGMSEISLTIENTKNILPTEYSEVTITRRLYRSGDSEYFLNKVPCRLKDIVDLFVDTGMGSDAYSVIELKMIEQILSDNAEERRRLFEEAAGITKYKHRRKQTFKKLESTALDLARVQDIVIEVEKKVGSLERQAKKAEQVKNLKEELKTLEIGLAERTLAELWKKLRPLRDVLPQHEMQKEELGAKIALIDAEIQKEQVQLLDKERSLSATQKDINAKSELITTTEKQLALNEERRKSLEESMVRASGESESYRKRIEELAVEKAQHEEALNAALSAYQQRKEEFEREKARQLDMERELREKRAALDDKRNESVEISRRISDLKLQAQSVQSKIENLQTAIERNEERQTTLQNRKTERETEKASIDARLAELKVGLQSAHAALESAKAQRNALLNNIERHKEELLHLRSELNSRKNRISFLTALLESYEGLPEGIKHLEKVGQKQYGLGSLSDLIATDEQYKLAINAALGESLEYYVSRTLDDARAGIAILKQAGKGKVTFALLDRIKAALQETPAETPAISGAARALDLVRCNEEIRPLARLLLSNTYVTETLEQATELGAAHPEALFTTSAGERYSARGFMRGGSTKESEGIRIGKREELEKLTAEKAAIETQIGILEEALSSAQSQLSEIRLSDYEQAVRQSEQTLMGTEKRHAQVEFEIGAFEKELSELQNRIVQDSEEETRFSIELESFTPEIASLEDGLSVQNRDYQIELEGIGAFEGEVQRFTEQVQQKNLGLKEAEFGLEKIRTQIQNAEQESRNASRQLERLSQEIENAQGEVFRLSSEIETMNANLRHLYTEKDALQKILAEVEFGYNVLKGEFNQNENELRDLRRRRDVESQMVFEFQQQISQHELKIENLQSVIKAEYDLELGVKEFGEDDPFNREESAARIGELKTKIKNLGAVNELALEEFEKEKARFDFLSSQRKDLLEAEKQLRDTIEEINKTAQEKFNSTFDQIRQNFIKIFRDLFNEGDEADLLIAESEDPLEANIDIIAKPKGKRPQSIMLLSGGEKTLTAISLLFAIYLVKPSPFCILDEVDAPLDDANIDRFAKLLQKFAKETQFIIVTHNKRTMEASRVLYGVTMEEEGVSKLVAVRMEDDVLQNTN
ncbi:MAG: chromosome segregation protein SMC [Chlorobiales bacterium]|nr:chromosome segregation protein SMC [Chlorobiales bacterium]